MYDHSVARGRVRASARVSSGVLDVRDDLWTAFDVAAMVARRHAVYQARGLMCASQHMSSEWLDVHDERDKRTRSRGPAQSKRRLAKRQKHGAV